ncbi:Lrp/AsnC family transcriptional regulator [Aeromicrobium sp.]|uniref:Lrp/AsnC family transcriptional regulator n=1 Tax=Aeromicrobium sp. TaxID=1871063 RepID=UPI0025C2985C|nr:Lrp/AsnC family transcriptional regulator [Aeromicrobium sp.]MCK5892782.1 Lrp/AsnC family transcriptional regulator [Aeromicrobium sp.]
MNLDATDHALLRALSTSGRSTFAQLAETTGLSTSATQARVRRLEAEGVITGYRVVIDPEEVGLPIAAFVEISPLDPAQPDDAPRRLEGISEITACHSIAGDASYMLTVRVPSPRALEELLGRIRSTAGVRTRTTVALQTFFERPVAPDQTKYV